MFVISFGDDGATIKVKLFGVLAGYHHDGILLEYPVQLAAVYPQKGAPRRTRCASSFRH